MTVSAPHPRVTISSRGLLQLNVVRIVWVSLAQPWHIINSVLYLLYILLAAVLWQQIRAWLMLCGGTTYPAFVTSISHPVRHERGTLAK
jgi:hypothetical protein